MLIFLSLLQCSSGMRPFLRSVNPSFTDVCVRQFRTAPVCWQKISEIKFPPRKHFAPKLSPQSLYQARHADKLDLSGYQSDTKNDLLYKYAKPKLHNQNYIIKKKRHPDTQNEAWPLNGISRDVPCQLVTKIANYEQNKLYSSIGYVVSQYNNFSTAGTGFLIAPDMVLTAAHNVMFSELEGDANLAKEQAKKIEFHLRYDNGKEHTPTQYCTSRLPQQWTTSFHPEYDFCVLFLPCRVNEPFLKLAAVTQNHIPISCEIVGYPGTIFTPPSPKKPKKNKPISRYASSGDITKLHQKKSIICHDAFTWSGNSGGPIAVYKDDKKTDQFCVGVHTSGNNDSNLGVHCATHMTQYVSKWVQEKDKIEDPSFKKLFQKIIGSLTQKKEEIEFLKRKADYFEKYSESDLMHMARVYLDGYRAQ